MQLIDLNWCIGKLDMSSPNTKPNSLIIVSPEREGHGVVIPACSVTIYGKEALKSLRDALNEAYPE